MIHGPSNWPEVDLTQFETLFYKKSMCENWSSLDIFIQITTRPLTEFYALRRVADCYSVCLRFRSAWLFSSKIVRFQGSIAIRLHLSLRGRSLSSFGLHFEQMNSSGISFRDICAHVKWYQTVHLSQFIQGSMNCMSVMTAYSLNSHVHIKNDPFRLSSISLNWEIRWKIGWRVFKV